MKLVDEHGVHGCKWDYTGTGTEYNLLAGPIFILIYTFAGIPIGLAADLYNRKVGLIWRCFIHFADPLGHYVIFVTVIE